MKKTIITFNILSKKQCKENILMLFENGIDNFTANCIINHFNFDRKKILTNPSNEVSSKINLYYNKKQMNDRRSSLEELWKTKSNEVLDSINEIFKFDYDGIQKYTVSLSINPVCPRYRNDYNFDIFINKNDDNIIETIIYELLHVYWFNYWENNLERLEINEKDMEQLTLAFSEIAIDVLITQSSLKNFISNNNPTYSFFYEIKYKGELLINKLRTLFNDNTLLDFMKKGLNIIKSEEVSKEILKKLE